MTDAPHHPAPLEDSNTEPDYAAFAPPSRMPAGQGGPWFLNRLIAVGIFVPCLAVLVLAAYLEPSASGMGTHQSLGLPACGFKDVTGIPCATCGCTTSFAHAANGSFLDAFLTQPFGATLALLTAMAVIITGYAAVTDMPLAPIGRALARGKIIAGMIGLLVLGWAYAIAIHWGG